MATQLVDSFTEAVDTPLGSHTPDTDTAGNGWVVDNGSWQVDGDSDYLEPTGASPGGALWLATVDVGVPYGVLEADVHLGASRSTSVTSGVVFRVLDDDNFWFVALSLNATTGFQLYRRQGGTYTAVDTQDLDLSGGTTYRVRVEFLGSDILIYIDGDLISAYSSTFNQAATKVGFRFADTNDHADNLSFTAEAPQSGVILDSFTEGSDTALGSHSPDIDVPGNGWVVDRGTMQVLASGDYLQPTGGAPGDPQWVASIDSEYANGKVQAEVHVGTGRTPSVASGIVFRMTDTANFWMLVIRTGGASSMQLYKRVSGSFTEVETATPTISAGNTYRVRAEFNGNDIDCYVDDVQQGSTVTDSHNASATKVGVRFADALDYVDNLYSEPARDAVAVTDDALYWSPYNWTSDGTDDRTAGNLEADASYAIAVNCGAYFKTKFTGTSLRLDVDVSDLVSASVAAANYPYLEWQVDGGDWSRLQLTASDVSVVLAHLLESGTHTVKVFLAAIQTTSNDRWSTPVMALKVDGFQVDSGSGLTAPPVAPYRLMVFGDSHAEGREVLGTGLTPQTQSARMSYAHLLAEDLNAEVGVVAFGGQGYTTGVGGSSNVPDMEDAYDFYFSTDSRLYGGMFSPMPNYVVSAHGDNDSGGAGLTTAVGNIQAALEAAAPLSAILFVPPPNYNAEGKLATIQNGVAVGGNTYWLDTGEDFQGDNASGVHMNSTGQILYANAIYREMASALALSSGSLSRSNLSRSNLARSS